MAKKHPLANVSLRERILKASGSLKTTELQELATALADAGFLQSPPSSIEVTDITVAELGEQLWRQVESNPKRKLTEFQVNAIVCHLIHKGWSPMSVASRLFVPVDRVSRIWREHSHQLGKSILATRMESVIGHLQARVDHLYQLAVEERDLKTASFLTFEFLRALQSLGVVHKRAEEHHVTVSIDTRSEIEQLVALEAKELESRQFLEKCDNEPSGDRQETPRLHGHAVSGDRGPAADRGGGADELLDGHGPLES